MKNKLKKETKIPSTREEILELIFLSFLNSDMQILRLALSDQEVNGLLEIYDGIHIEKGSNIYPSINGLSIYNVLKQKI